MEKLAIFGGTPVRENKIFYGRQCIEQDDVDAVVEQLEKYSKSKICLLHEGCPYMDDDNISCENCGAIGAIDIVRKGGKE